MPRAQNVSVGAADNTGRESVPPDARTSTEDVSSNSSRRPRRGRLEPPSLARRLRDPRSVILVLMALVLVFGGGRKLLRARMARKATARLGEPDVTPEEILSAAQFGRTALFELFEVFSSSDSPEKRKAAGLAIARIWADDQLVAEEEQAFAKRSFDVEWYARRRYPRLLQHGIPIVVQYRLPFVTDEGPGLSNANLEWSHRIVGARRTSLELESPWKSGVGRVDFSLIPNDFETNGPHQLVLETKLRTTGLTGSWQIDMPKMPFRFEFDPTLQVDSLATLPDSQRRTIIEGAISLEGKQESEDESPIFLPIGPDFAIRNPPWIEIQQPLPCDLSHAMEVEFEGINERIPAGTLMVRADAWKSGELAASSSSTSRYPLQANAESPVDSLDRPGPQRIRVHLKPDPGLGWGVPDIRSVWPEGIVTNWEQVQIIRR